MSEFKPVPNQRFIVIKKADNDYKKAKNQRQYVYSTINLNALEIACSKLQSKAGIKLYLYFAKNKDNYKFYLSRENFLKFAGVSATAYNTAFNELVKYGFLELQEDKEIKYIFHEMPIEKDNRKEENAGFHF